MPAAWLSIDDGHPALGQASNRRIPGTACFNANQKAGNHGVGAAASQQYESDDARYAVGKRAAANDRWRGKDGKQAGTEPK